MTKKGTSKFIINETLKEDICNKHIKENLSVSIISKILKLPTNSIIKILKEKNILKMRPQGFQKGHKQFNSGKTHFKKERHSSQKTEFKKRMTPWNKDRRGYHLSKETEFKKGRVPWNKNNNLKTDGIISLYKNMRSITKIAKRFRCGKTTIYRILKKNNIDTSLKGNHHNSEEHKRKAVETRMKNDSYGEEWRKKISAKSQGIPIGQWKKFKHFEPYDEKFSNSFKNLIRNRDNQVCMNCRIHREKLDRALDVHHINYDKLLSIPENCISLCNRCHVLTNINRIYWTKLFQEKLAQLYNYQYSEKGIILNLKDSLLKEVK